MISFNVLLLNSKGAAYLFAFSSGAKNLFFPITTCILVFDLVSICCMSTAPLSAMACTLMFAVEFYLLSVPCLQV
jgi:hypothetical protein